MEPVRAAVTPVCPRCNRLLDIGYDAIDPVTLEAPATCVAECGWAGPASKDLDWYLRRSQPRSSGGRPGLPAKKTPLRTRKK